MQSDRPFPRGHHTGPPWAALRATVTRSFPGLAIVLVAVAGCGGGPSKSHEPFFTSGSREADQRASQKMTQAEQLAGTSQGGGSKAGEKDSGSKTNSAGIPRAEGKQALYERLGGVKGLTGIVADFIPRAMHDPRVNWERKGIDMPGFFRRGPAVTWMPTPQNVAVLQQHIVQFLSLATGGPAGYGGAEIKAVHSNMQITNAEFDATVGDLKASLDRLRIPDREQKELLAIIETTRTQVVTER